MLNIQQALEHLSNEGILAYPTDTVYGLGCLPSNTQALNALLNFKNRKRQFIVLTDDWNKHLDWINEPIDINKLEAYSKPTTWVLKATNLVPDKLKNEDNEFAMRKVSHKDTLCLLSQLSEPLVSTSANQPGQPTLSKPEDITSILKFPILVGKNGGSQPSQILRYSDGKIIRP